MTISGWLIWAVVSGIIVTVAVGMFADIFDFKKAAAAGVVLSLVVLGGMLFYYNFTAGGKRAFKTQQSSLENGIERTVKVYDVTGNVIKEYSGKFDIDYDDNRIIFDDENGKRHVIYYPTGTVIVDEK